MMEPDYAAMYEEYIQGIEEDCCFMLQTMPWPFVEIHVIEEDPRSVVLACMDENRYLWEEAYRYKWQGDTLIGKPKRNPYKP